MIVDSALYNRGKRIAVDCEIHDYDRLRAGATEPGDFVWVGLYKPTEAELSDVAKAFGLHPLAVEDAVNSHQRPKLDHYDDSLFLVLKTLWYVDEDDAVETGEINIFLGHDFVITVRHGMGSQLQSARAYLESMESGARATAPRPWSTPSATPSSTATPRWSTSSRSTSTRSRRRCSRRPAPTTRSGSTPSSGRSPRCAGR